MTEGNPAVLEALHDRVLTITLNRPERRNAIAPESTAVLRDVLERAASNADVGAIVLTGAGSNFCVGGDVGRMAVNKTFNAEETRAKLDFAAQTVLLLRSCAKPTIAMMRGACAGGGLGFALGCDFRYGDETTKFSYAYTRIGLSGDFAVNWLLQDILGTVRAREFAMFCPVVAASEARSLGLLNEIFPADDLEARVMERARQLAHSSTLALGHIKKNLNAAAQLSQADAIATETETFIDCYQTADHRDAAQAFIEKRAPRFNQR